MSLNQNQDQIDPKQSPLLLFLILLALWFLGVLIGTLLINGIGGLLGISNFSELFNSMKEGEYLEYYNIAQILLMINSIAAFIFPSLLFVYLFYKQKQKDYLLINHSNSWLHYILAILFIIVLAPAFVALVKWNQGLVEGSSSNQTITEVIGKMNSITDLLLNLLLVGVIAGLGEELLFRGILQRIFSQITKNIHLGIWITGAVFSIIHDNQGFFPRLLMGVSFGYLLWWSGSLWVPIITHAFFNSIQLIIQYNLPKDLKENPTETVIPISWILGSIALSSLIAYAVWTIHKKSDRKLNTATYLNP